MKFSTPLIIGCLLLAVSCNRAAEYPTDAATIVSFVDLAIAEYDLFEQASRSHTPGAYRDYLTQYPEGKFREEVSRRLENFSAEEGVARALIQEIVTGLSAVKVPATAYKTRSSRFNCNPSKYHLVKELERKLNAGLQSKIRGKRDNMLASYLEFVEKELSATARRDAHSRKRQRAFNQRVNRYFASNFLERAMDPLGTTRIVTGCDRRYKLLENKFAAEAGRQLAQVKKRRRELEN